MAAKVQLGRSVVYVLQGNGESSREVGLEDVLRLVENLKQLSAADTDDTDTVEAFVALGGKVSSIDMPFDTQPASILDSHSVLLVG